MSELSRRDTGLAVIASTRVDCNLKDCGISFCVSCFVNIDWVVLQIQILVSNLGNYIIIEIFKTSFNSRAKFLLETKKVPFRCRSAGYNLLVFAPLRYDLTVMQTDFMVKIKLV